MAVNSIPFSATWIEVPEIVTADWVCLAWGGLTEQPGSSKKIASLPLVTHFLNNIIWSALLTASPSSKSIALITEVTAVEKGAKP